MGALNSSPAQRATWYRARKPLPAMTVIVLLSMIVVLVWVGVLNRPDDGGCRITGASVASSVAPAPVTGTRLVPDAMDTVPPAPPQRVVVQVLNANGKRGEAAVVATELAELGFIPTAEPTNDPLHPTFDLNCHGEIRFGATGQAAARTLSLAVPCAELVRDERPDEVIDLALGTEFTGLRPNDAAREALRRLHRLGRPVDVSPHGQPVAGVASPALDPELLRRARAAVC